MGCCESYSNKKAINNNAQNPNPATITTKTQQNIPKTTVQRNTNVGEKFVSNNINNNPQNGVNKQISNVMEDIDRPSNTGRRVSLGSSINMDDSIGYNQTRNTYIPPKKK